MALASGAMQSTRYPGHGRARGNGGWPSANRAGETCSGFSRGAAAGPDALDV